MRQISESETETEDEKTMEERAQLMRTVSQQLEDQKKNQLRSNILEKQGKEVHIHVGTDNSFKCSV